jgi:hypothetical protein
MLQTSLLPQSPRPKSRNLRWAIITVICVITIANYLDRVVIPPSFGPTPS